MTSYVSEICGLPSSASSLYGGGQRRDGAVGGGRLSYLGGQVRLRELRLVRLLGRRLELPVEQALGVGLGYERLGEDDLELGGRQRQHLSLLGWAKRWERAALTCG